MLLLCTAWFRPTISAVGGEDGSKRNAGKDSDPKIVLGAKCERKEVNAFPEGEGIPLFPKETLRRSKEDSIQ